MARGVSSAWFSRTTGTKYSRFTKRGDPRLAFAARSGGASTAAASSSPSHSRSGLEFAYRELCDPRLLLVSLAISCAFVLFFTVAGPGSDLLADPLQRTAYFGLIGALAWPLGHCTAFALLYCLRRGRTVHLVLASLAAGLYVAANIATVAYALYGLMRPHGPPPPGWPLFYVRAAVASVVHFGLIHYFAVQLAKLRSLPEGRPETARSTVIESTPSGRFLDRLPVEVGRDVVYLKVNGHYINVITTAGSAAVLMRLADAVAELGDLGLQVHRSFWVASRHVTEVFRREGRTVVQVTGGAEVPVSRTFLAAVRKLADDKGRGVPRERSA